MNTRLTPFLLLLALVHNVGANDDGNKPQIIRSYLSQLPEDSALREASETTPRWQLCKSKEQRALEFLESVCKTCYAMDEYQIKYMKVITVMGEGSYGFTEYIDKKNIKVAIRTILQDNPDELKWQEYDHVLHLVHKLNAEREQELQRKKEECKRDEEERKKELLIERERPF